MNTETQFLGELSPITLNRHNNRPDRREVSKRWLASSVLVGVTSSLLMGGALYAALEGKQQLTLPAQVLEQQQLEQSGSNGVKSALKGNHPGLFAKLNKQEKSNVIMASTISRDGDKNIVKARPFMKIKSSMAIARQQNQTYPSFNPLAVFSGKDTPQEIPKSNDFLYGAEVESEVTLNIVDFPFDQVAGNLKPRQRSSDVLSQVIAAASGTFGDDAVISALTYFDTERFSGENKLILSNADVTITPENVSVLSRSRDKDYQGVFYDERLIEVRNDASISEIFLGEGLQPEEVEEIQVVLESDLGTSELKKGDTLQTWFENKTTSSGERVKTMAKVSIYRGTAHLVSIARTDEKQFVYAAQTERPGDLIDEADITPSIPANKLPSIYDGIYRSALNEGLTQEMTASLIKIFAFDVDFKSRVTPRDQLEVFMSLEDGEETPTESSEILYASIQLGKIKRRYYRFQDEKTGYVDYYDETGKSAKKFLLRQPVPNGKFRSPYGMRRHPISRRFKLHGGVDWSAPHGSPILAAGNGVVEKAGWAGGSGKRTIIKHANGYETYYLHQTRYARGIRPGARVRQGQVIGFVGSTGYSTGPHLHYEVHVNGNRVDPMRIKLPKGRVLRDEELVRFEAERQRIDALVNEGEEIETALN